MGPYYFGGSFGWTDIDTGVSAVTGTAKLDEEDTGYKFFAGLELNKIFSAEVHYANIGEATLTGNNGDTFVLDGAPFTFTANGTTMEAEGTSFGISALARLPIDGKIKPFVKLGVHFWDIDAKLSSPVGTASFNDDGTDIFYGVGVEVEAADRLSARAEFERFDDVDFLSIGLVFRGK